ncbi:hypothetical protein WDU94_001671 [Cyamophila willieti]
MTDNIYILDNGAYSAKVGLSSFKIPKIVPNCIMKAKSERRRPFIGDQVDECRDASGLFYILPFQKGYLINLDIQKTVWDYIFSKDCCPANFTENPAIVTEPYFNFMTIQEAMTEIFFEEYECQSLLRINAGDLSAYHYRHNNPGTLCVLVVDIGYSFTHVVPYIRGKKLKDAIRRIDVGGKLLTNHLKDVVSYRQLHVMDETHVINQVKEDACYVSQDFYRDMEVARRRDGEDNSIVREYVLPDYTTLKRGYLRKPGSEKNDQFQTLRLTNERFAIPEVLFHPSDIGIDQMGLSEAIDHVISLCPEPSRPHLYENILLTGGCCGFPGLRERVASEVRALAPDEMDVNVVLPPNPITYAWEGGKLISQDPEFYSYVVTKEEYEEEGLALCYERFDI